MPAPGAYDECIRHALTKMSHLHFTTKSEAVNLAAARRQSNALL